jgi:hypothetical protein
MKRNIAKATGYPIFVLLGGVLIDVLFVRFPFLFPPLMLVYALVVILCASDPAVYRLSFKYRLLGVVTLAMAVWWIHRWPLNLGFMLVVCTMGTLDSERCARNKRIRAWIRSLSHSA